MVGRLVVVVVKVMVMMAVMMLMEVVLQKVAAVVVVVAVVGVYSFCSHITNLVSTNIQSNDTCFQSASVSQTLRQRPVFCSELNTR